MSVYILRRFLLIPPTLLGMTVLIFFIMWAAPGEMTRQSDLQGLEPAARQSVQAYYQHMYGLNDAPWAQYAHWLNNISPVGFTFDASAQVSGFSFLKGSDLGHSFHYGRPVMDLIAERVPVTLLLNLLSLPLIYLLAIQIGVRAASRQNQAFDIGANIITLALWSLPAMLSAVVLIGFFASDQHWHWFPAAGLSQREALDMPFLPHWQYWRDSLAVFAFSALGVVAALVWSDLKARSVRVLGAGLLGMVLAVLALNGHAQPLLGLLQVVLVVVFAALFAATAYSDWRALRRVVIGGSGLILGLLLAANVAEGAFVRGWLLDRLWHLVLPVLVLSYGGLAFLSRLTRASVLENLQADYVRTARAKGLGEHEVIWHHAFRNSLLALITLSAAVLPGLLAGSVIVESVFSIDGMGRLVLDAVQARDRELVLSLTLISGVLALFANLLADVLYALADPRVRYD